ncbi:MAG: Histidinol-phosphate aminotransferase [Rhodanobacteraceae bacterium]|jgi:histidinol-phosphate aminotransferase|nr:MAG: Histidinol-phosphate aminotransferase [Rhodanobacteraceae bacterium]
MNPVELARPEIRSLQPYSSARMEASGGEVWLNANESPWPPFDGDGGWNRYPDPQPAMLMARLAKLYGVRDEQLLVGRGSDEGIDLLVRAFCAAGRDAILISPPTFGMYAACARVQGAAVVEAPLGADFQVDVDVVLAAMTPAVKLVFVCAPSNPAGASVSRVDILRLAAALEGRALLVVDEAYVEFADPRDDSGSVADCVGKLANLVVLRTLSKAWALAGVRVGSVLADARVIALLRRIMPPYPLPVPCVELALRALSGEGAMRERVAVIRRERTRMRKALAVLACVREVLPSQANFLAVRFADAGAAYAALLAAGVVVRDVRRYPRLGDALRISLGTPAENDRVLDVLRCMASEGARAELPA